MADCNCGTCCCTDDKPDGVAILDYLTAEEVARCKVAWDELLKTRTAEGVRFGDALWLTDLADN